MSQSILLRGARQLLTLRSTPGVRRGPLLGDLGIIEDGSVLIQGGKIVSVGPTRRLENLKAAQGALVIPVHNCVVMPGFVDPLIQLSLTTTNAAGRVKRRKFTEFQSESLTLLRSCLQHGTLNAAVKASSGIRSRGADLSVLRQLARIGHNPVGLTRVWRPDANDADMPDAETVLGTLQAISGKRLADSVELKSVLCQSALEVFLPGVAHSEISLSLDWSGGSAAGLKSTLERCQPASVFCDHDLGAETQQVLAGSKATAVFKAGGALLENQPGGCLRELVDMGGAVALGSGYDAQYELNYNMQLVLALAVMRLRLTLEEAIVATTINAAYAINCGDEMGSLEPGKRAEVLVLNLSDYREIPRRLGVNHVAMAIRDGNLAINRTRWRVGAA